MSFDFTCPHCHAKFHVDDTYRGQSGNCAECGKPIVMPGKQPKELTDLEGHKIREQQKQRARIAVGIRFVIAAVATAIMLTLGYVATYLLWPEIQIARAKRDVYVSLSQMQAIAKALNAYSQEYGSYPTPAVVDAKGVPLYSWRVLILPQLGYQNLYDQFDLDSAWDSEQNVSLISRMPSEFKANESSTNLFEGETAITLIVGNGTLFPTSGPLSPTQILDFTTETILVTEAMRSNNTWSAPFDTTFSGAIAIGNRPGIDVGVGRQAVTPAVAVSGDPLIISNNVLFPVLRGLITPNGSEMLPNGNFAIEMLDQYEHASP